MINILNKKHDLANYFNLQYIGRGSILGNRWSHIPEGTKAEFVVATRDEAIDSFEKWIRSIINSDKEVTKELIRLYEIYDTIGELNLVCYCAPKRCHGGVIAKLIEEKWIREHNHLVNGL